MHMYIYVRISRYAHVLTSFVCVGLMSLVFVKLVFEHPLIHMFVICLMFKEAVNVYLFTYSCCCLSFVCWRAIPMRYVYMRPPASGRTGRRKRIEVGVGTSASSWTVLGGS